MATTSFGLTPLPSLTQLFLINNQILQWTLLSGLDGSPIDDATVTATLYVGRSATNPDATPGTPVLGLNGLALTYVLGTSGIYRGTVPNTFDPNPLATGYVLVIDANSPTGGINHWELPTVITPRAS